MPTEVVGADSPRAVVLGEYAALAVAHDLPPSSLAELDARYEALLPRVAVSRCPLTQQVFETRIDTGGLDGPWWRYQDPVRPFDPVPGTLYAFTGALRPGGTIEPAPFQRKPGPEAPFVVPNMLLNEDVKAVISHLQVGAHDGYPVTYFADPAPEAWQRFNDWGTEMYWPLEGDGVGWDQVVEENEPLDFDLAPWIEQGKLLWIAPGDTALTLRSGVADCPYLDLPGRRAFYYIEPDGLVWEPVPQPEVI